MLNGVNAAQWRKNGMMTHIGKNLSFEETFLKKFDHFSKPIALLFHQKWTFLKNCFFQKNTYFIAEFD